MLLAGTSSHNLLFYFRFGQTWSETKTLPILQWRAFPSTYPLMLPSTFPREALLLGTCLPSLRNLLFLLDALALIPLSLANVRLSLNMTLPHFRSGALDRRICSFLFSKGDSGIIANSYLGGTEAILSFSAGPICSSFSTEA